MVGRDLRARRYRRPTHFRCFAVAGRRGRRPLPSESADSCARSRPRPRTSRRTSSPHRPSLRNRCQPCRSTDIAAAPQYHRHLAPDAAPTPCSRPRSTLRLAISPLPSPSPTPEAQMVLRTSSTPPSAHSHQENSKPPTLHLHLLSPPSPSPRSSVPPSAQSPAPAHQP